MQPAAPNVADDDDSPTQSVAAHRAATASTQGGAAATPLQAVFCASRHPNPPHSDQCRVCRAAITDRNVQLIARPSLGILRLPDGTDISLDRPVVLGRKPGTDLFVGGEAALPVALPDPDKLLSRTHAEVRLVDWQVQVVDRDSMNHTYIEIPGQIAMQLRPAEPFPIPPGTKINLGDAVFVTYLVVDR